MVLSIGSMLFAVQKDKVGVADLEKVYEGYLLKKELQKKLEGSHSARQSVLDSLKLELSSLSAATSSGSSSALALFNSKRENYIAKEQEFNQETEGQLMSYKDQVSKRLVDFCKEYGQQKGFAIILFKGSGESVVYSSANVDITDDFIQFINKRHSGGK